MNQSGEHHLRRFVYEDKDFLGQGSFGKVFKGIDPTNNQAVALKIMDMSLFTDKFMIDALKTEVSVMKELKSINTVRLLDMFGDDQQTIIVIELCNGGDLRSFLEQHGGTLDEKTATDVLQQVMQGFKEMVGLGYIHRDIKPENFLIHNNIHKVADFGFACKCDIHGKQLLRECVGTPLYMAPQLLEQVPYSAKCDIWSIGILTFEMVYGRQPWPCRDCNSYLKNIKCMPLKFPYEKEVSEEFKDFIKKCLEVNDSQRIGWDDVFNHPLLMKSDKTFSKQEIDPRSQYILKEIQELVQHRNINVHEQFDKIKGNKGGELNQNEFYDFLHSFDPRVTQSEAIHLFQLFDKNGDGSLSFEEFRRIFCEFDFADLSDRTGQIITDLKEIIKANKLNLKEIFANFDQDKGGQLDLQEFSRLIRVIAPAIKQQEITKVFQRFDINGDQNISFDEFKDELVYAIPGQDSQFSPSQEKAQKIITELKRIVKDNNVDYTQIFKNFDKDGSNSLDLNEFAKLCQIIDKSLTASESKDVFQLVDKQNQGIIKIDQFQKLFV